MPRKRNPVRMSVRPENINQTLNVARHNGSYGGTRDTKLREAKFAENKEPVEHQIHRNCCDSGLHRKHRLAAFTQCRCINRRYGERRKPYKHDHKICFCRSESIRYTSYSVARIMQIEVYQFVSACQHEHNKQQQHDANDVKLGSETLGNTFMVALAEELGAENSRTRYSTETDHDVHKHKIPDDRHPGHWVCAKSSD